MLIIRVCMNALNKYTNVRILFRIVRNNSNNNHNNLSNNNRMVNNNNNKLQIFSSIHYKIH